MKDKVGQIRPLKITNYSAWRLALLTIGSRDDNPFHQHLNSEVALPENATTEQQKKAKHAAAKHSALFVIEQTLSDETIRLLPASSLEKNPQNRS